MRNYETIYIVRPALGKDDLTGVIDKMTNIINQNGGAIRQVDHWGIRKLAYTIKKESQGYYVYTTYTGEPGTVLELERNLRIDDKIIKYLTIKLKEFREFPLGKTSEKTTEDQFDEAEEEA